MKKIHLKIFWALLIIMLVPSISFAQEDTGGFSGFDLSNPLNQQSSLAAMLGYTNIGGDQFVGMRIQPEFNFGKLGFGLDVPLFFSLNDGFKFRKEEFTGGIGVLRMFRYLSWGVKKRDPFFVRVGDLTDSYIGYGMLVDNYSNSVSFDKRKTGISWDVCIKDFFGIEGLYSDFDAASLNLLALRPYVKPLSHSGIPILKTMDIGFTFVKDKDKTYIETDSTKYQTNKFLKGDGMQAWAVDMGFIPINRSFMQLRAYAQYGNLKKVESASFKDSLNDFFTANPHYGDSALMANYKSSHGFSVGVDLRLKAAGNMFMLYAKLERLWYNNYFMPQFFNATYEMNKDARIFGLASANGKKGIYGALSIIAMEKVQVGGSLMIPDDATDNNPAILTLNLDASRLMDKFILTAQYLKGNLTGLKDAFKLDDRSMLTARAGYKLYKFLVVGLDYKWTWSVLEDGTYQDNRYISPYVGFQMPFEFGKNSKPIDLGE